MAPANAKLRAVEAQISDTLSHIGALNEQVAQAEAKLKRLREHEAAILDTTADHRRVLSAVRHLPEDILREICIACVVDDVPELSKDGIPLPYVLGQISSGIRRVVLATPIIWAHLEVPYYHFSSDIKHKHGYSTLARMAGEWLKRAGGLPLTLLIDDSVFTHKASEDAESDPSNVLFDALLNFSTTWKEIKLRSRCHHLTRPMVRISALTSADLPLLESVSLEYRAAYPTRTFRTDSSKRRRSNT